MRPRCAAWTILAAQTLHTCAAAGCRCHTCSCKCANSGRLFCRTKDCPKAIGRSSKVFGTASKESVPWITHVRFTKVGKPELPNAFVKLTWF